VPISRVRIVTVLATMMLFSSATAKAFFGSNTSMKFWTEIGLGIGVIWNWSLVRRSELTIIQ
jgi:hypothetical protein